MEASCNLFEPTHEILLIKYPMSLPMLPCAPLHRRTYRLGNLNPAISESRRMFLQPPFPSLRHHCRRSINRTACVTTQNRKHHIIVQAKMLRDVDPPVLPFAWQTEHRDGTARACQRKSAADPHGASG